MSRENFTNLKNLINQDSETVNPSFNSWLQTKLRNGLNQQRLKIRSKIFPFTNFTVLSILPFLIGFFEFVGTKTPGKTTFFKKNLPLLQNPVETVQWDTIQYILKNSFSISPNWKLLLETNKIESFWYQNSTILNQNIFLNHLGQPLYLGNIKKINSSQKDYSLNTITTGFQQSSSIFQKKSTTPSQISFGKNEWFSSELDELPAYLESFFPKQVVDQAPSTQNSIFWKTPSQSLPTISESTSKFVSQKYLFEDSILLNKPLSRGLENSEFSPIEQKTNTSEFKNEFYKLKRKFYTNWLQLQNQLKIVFTEKQFLASIPGIENKKTENVSNSRGEVDLIFLDTFCTHFFQNNDDKTESEFYKFLEQLQLSPEFLKPRNMSGYRYPDMTTSQVNTFLLQKSFFGEKNNFVKIPLNNLGFQIQKDAFSDFNSVKSTDFKLISQVDYQFLPKITFPTSFDFLNFHFISAPATENFLEDENFNQTEASGVYKNILSAYFKSKTRLFDFHDMWEPLTFRSWLIVSQLSFAFLSFKVLTELADNYGRELLVYLLDIVARKGFVDDDIKQELEILLNQREKGFRIISKSNKKFTDLVGMDNILRQLGDILWYLRSSGKSFSRKNPVPKGVLLTGPPGTGKTLLVQALAGEAQVPVLALSGSSLIKPGESAAIKLEMMFQEARRLAPCIVFIDEIDTLAQKREQIILTPMGDDDDEEDIFELFITPVSFFRKVFSSTSNSSKFSTFGSMSTPSDPYSSLSSNSQENSTQSTIQEEIFSQQNMQREQLRLLMQLLVELDGMKRRHGVIVFGATNRPEVLDPAVLRPGRMDQVLHIGLPDAQKRVDILKFYGQQLGYDLKISWDYLSDRTEGFSSADLSTLMNQSCLKAILLETHHTLETIEHGIDRITTAEIHKPYIAVLKEKLEEDFVQASKYNLSSIQFKFSVEIARLAYYQSGKILLSRLLQNHPPIVVAHLWPRTPNSRARKISINLERYFFYLARRSVLETRLVGCYAGKAAEVLFLQNTSNSYLKALKNPIKKKDFETLISLSTVNEKSDVLQDSKRLNLSNLSNLGLEDLRFGQEISYFMVEKTYLFSIKNAIRKTIELTDNRNIREQLSQEKREFCQQLVTDFELKPTIFNKKEVYIPFDSTLDEDSSQTEKEKEKEKAKHKYLDQQIEQTYYQVPWWQKSVFDELELADKVYSDWYNIYMPIPEERETNIYWCPPDTFYHNNELLAKISSLPKMDFGKESSKNSNQIKNQSENLATNKVNQKQDSQQNFPVAAGSYQNDKLGQKVKATNIFIGQSETQPETKQANAFDLITNTQKPDWTDLEGIVRDYQIQSLILQSFNRALGLLDQNRELLDLFASELISREILRKPEISELLENFIPELFSNNKDKEVESTNQETEYSPLFSLREGKSLICVIDSRTGSQSRRKQTRWIDFCSLN